MVNYIHLFAGIGVLAILIAIAAASFYGVKTVTIHPVAKFIDPADGDSYSYYLVEDRGGNFIELQRPFYNWHSNIDKLYTKDTAQNQTMTYECFGWELDQTVDQVWLKQK